MNDEEVPFDEQMRIATRDVHNFSNTLINAKLAFALCNDKVWAEGLQVFYEIFKFLEEAMKRHQGDTLGEFHIPEMDRTAAFEKDIEYYLGKNWRTNYKIRDTVANYVDYMRRLEEENPTLLTVFVYHLHMGLLTGGQILKSKRALFGRLFPSREADLEGNAITHFENIGTVKAKMYRKMNKLGESVDEEMRQRLIFESRKVFELSNAAVQSIRGANMVFLMQILKISAVVIPTVALVMYYKKRVFNFNDVPTPPSVPSVKCEAARRAMLPLETLDTYMVACGVLGACYIAFMLAILVCFLRRFSCSDRAGDTVGMCQHPMEMRPVGPYYQAAGGGAVSRTYVSDGTPPSNRSYCSRQSSHVYCQPQIIPKKPTYIKVMPDLSQMERLATL